MQYTYWETEAIDQVAEASGNKPRRFITFTTSDDRDTWLEKNGKEGQMQVVYVYTYTYMYIHKRQGGPDAGRLCVYV